MPRAAASANALFVAFYASFAVQRSTEPTGVGRLQRPVAWLSLDEGRLTCRGRLLLTAPRRTWRMSSS
jgi:hypothetical protein